MLGKKHWLCVALLATTMASGQPLHQPLQSPSHIDWPHTDKPVRLFVRLSEPSVGEMRAQALRSAAGEPSRREQRRQARVISRQQARVGAAIAPFIRRELGRLRVAVNGIKVLAPRASIPILQKLPGVRHVSPIAHQQADNAASVGWVQAPEVWESLGDGDGLTIAIIDTGIDYLHANFGGAGDPDEYAGNDKNRIEPGSFPTAKVIGGWDFAGPTYNSREDDMPQPDPDPLDGNGHGSHVAGTAAGIGVELRIGPGVAKGASLLALKVFSDESGSTDLTADAIDYALDPDQDGALDDRVDVINMSLGSRFGDPNDPAALASDVAAQNGVVVVASAGNNGDRAYVTGSPAVSLGAISVAATIAGGRPQDALRVLSSNPSVAGLYTAAEGAGPVRVVDTPLIRPLIRALGPRGLDDDGQPLPGPDNDQACASLSNHVDTRNHIVLVRTGGCRAETKYAVVQQAGGAGIVVYRAGADPDLPVTMGGIGLSGKSITIPGMMIAGGAGEKLVEALQSGGLQAEFNVANTAPPKPELADRMTFFTSRGPAHGGAGFKPELAAPGRFIMSTDGGSGFRGRRLRGTSMAAPHVAGAATLLRQRYPDIDVPAIKALLQNATVVSQFDGPGSDTIAPLMRQGVGVIRIADTLALGSYALPGSVSFGYQNTAVDTQREAQIAVRDLSGKDRLFEVTHQPRGALPGVEVICPGPVSVPAGGRSTVRIRFVVTAAQLLPDPGFTSHREADGWCVLSDDRDTLRIGYVGAADPTAQIGVTTTARAATLTNTGVATGLAHGFRLIGLGGDMGQDASRAIVATGFRFADTFGLNVFQLAVALDAPWESPAHVSMQLFIDPDRNGRYDHVLFAGDWSLLGFDPGTYVTGVFRLNPDGEPDFASGYLDWIAEEVDFNDAVVFLSWTMNPELGLSFLKPDQSEFDYRLVVFSRDGTYDVQTGFVDLDHDRVTSSDAIAIGAGQTRTVDYPHHPPDLWLLPGNHAGEQHLVTSPSVLRKRSTVDHADTKMSAP